MLTMFCRLAIGRSSLGRVWESYLLPVATWLQWRGSLVLSVFEIVHVLGDTRILHPPIEHGEMEINDVGGFESTTSGGEMVKVGEYLHFVEEGSGVLERQEPHVFDDGKEEDAWRLTVRMRHWCSSFAVHALCPDEDSVGGIGYDDGIVGDKCSFEAVEVMAKLAAVSRRLVDET